MQGSVPQNAIAKVVVACTELYGLSDNGTQCPTLFLCYWFTVRGFRIKKENRTTIATPCAKSTVNFRSLIIIAQFIFLEVLM